MAIRNQVLRLFRAGPGRAQNPHRTLLALTSDGCVGFITLMTTRITLSDSSGFTTKRTKVIEFGSPDAASFYEIDMIDDGRV